MSTNPFDELGALDFTDDVLAEINSDLNDEVALLRGELDQLNAAAQPIIDMLPRLIEHYPGTASDRDWCKFCKAYEGWASPIEHKGDCIHPLIVALAAVLEGTP